MEAQILMELDALVTKLTGGAVGEVAGSGRATIADAAREAGTPKQDITLTYTAVTPIKGMVTIDTDWDCSRHRLRWY